MPVIQVDHDPGLAVETIRGYTSNIRETVADLFDLATRDVSVFTYPYAETTLSAYLAETTGRLGRAVADQEFVIPPELVPDFAVGENEAVNGLTLMKRKLVAVTRVFKERECFLEEQQIFVTVQKVDWDIEEV